jgi:hypothetical protein
MASVRCIEFKRERLLSMSRQRFHKFKNAIEISLQIKQVHYMCIFSKRLVTSLFILLVMPVIVQGDVPAFPGAEGFGAAAIGGRGGRVIEVTTLEDSGPGSLRAAVDASGSRIVVFRVSGTIALKSRLQIRNPYITIAGQTAPGDGICVKDYDLQIETDQVIVRYIRFRAGDNMGVEVDGIWVGKGHHIILDHCSASWSVDETISVSSRGGIDSVTVQWCMITESLNSSTHSKGRHGYGSLIRGSHGEQYTFHHNLYAHHIYRSPWVGNYLMPDEDSEGLIFDFRNNVVYNWGGDHAGANSRYRYSGIAKVNFVGNYYKRGQDSTGDYGFMASMTWGRGFFQDNFMNGQCPEDPWALVKFDKFLESEKDIYKQSQPFPAPPVTMQSPTDAFARVLQEVGASLPKRDAVDRRIIENVRNGTGRIIDSEESVGGWPVLTSVSPPEDSDHDGMPDTWERTKGLNPNDETDGAFDRNNDGYTNVEEYLNSLCSNSKE